MPLQTATSIFGFGRRRSCSPNLNALVAVSKGKSLGKCPGNVGNSQCRPISVISIRHILKVTYQTAALMLLPSAK